VGDLCDKELDVAAKEGTFNLYVHTVCNSQSFQSMMVFTSTINPKLF
jgi:hypothetical protein